MPDYISKLAEIDGFYFAKTSWKIKEVRDFCVVFQIPLFISFAECSRADEKDSW